ncbi:MAG: TonB family protein [Muribaculaceae bacterium]|nr:TonB family protein [Muribaculaceae bacterium]
MQIERFIMISCRLRFLLVSIAIIAAVGAAAQMRRVVAHHSHGRHQTSAVEVYEYDYVDFQPHFPGGECAMMRYINSSRRYPAEAYARGIEGRVMCGFIVNPDGLISHVSVIKGVEESLNREAVRLINEMPRWVAGKIGHCAVPVYCVLPIAFRK